MADGRLPSGIVSFVFTDIVGSTRLLRDHGQAVYERLLLRHRSVLEAAWRANGGAVVSRPGDGYLVAFDDATRALQAMTDAQRALASTTWPDGVAASVRMGSHCGLAAPVDDDYVALAVHQAARVCAVANGGSILLTREVADRDGNLADASLRSLGHFRVRDFDEPIELLQVTAPDLDPDPPAVRARPASDHNLVRPPSSFVGRDGERAALAGMLQPGRLVTVVGTGGIGKTRLAVETGFSALATWPDGTWFADVSLGESDPVRSVAQAMGLPEARATVEGLVERLGSGRVLVVLDNCESSPDQCADAAVALLSACPNLGILATSREALGVPGEQLLRLGPLPLDPAGEGPALELFEARWHDANASAEWSERERTVAADICRMVDGQPLALELAAAQSSRLSLGEIRSSLEHDLRVLSIRRAGIPERHRSMASVIAWSFGRLGPEEQAALACMTVFDAPCSLDAALAAAGGDASLDDVFALADRSLVEVEVTANETRYRLFETVRQYVTAERGQADAVAAAVRLLRWYRQRFDPADSTDPRAVGELVTDQANLRAALALGSGRLPQPALALVWVLGKALDARHRLGEAVELLTTWSGRLDTPSPERVAVLTLLADVHLRRGEVDLARGRLREAEQLRDAVGAPDWDDAGVERTLGEILVRTGEIPMARALVEQVRARPLSPRGRARLENLAGIAALSDGDFAAAESAFTEELAAYESLGLLAPLASAHGNVAEAALGGGHLRKAAHHQRRCLELAVALGQPVMVAFSAIVAGRLAAGRDDPAALTLLTGAQVILDRTGVRLYQRDLDELHAAVSGAAQRLGPAGSAAARALGSQLDDAGLAERAGAALAAAEQQAPP